MLNESLDRMDAPAGSRDNADAVARSLDAATLREVALIHLAALLDSEPSEISDNDLRIGGMQLKLSATDAPDATIRYDDVQAGYFVSGAEISRNEGPRSLGDMLTLLQYARDRSDTLLYLPNDIRGARIADLAKRTGSGERFVRFVLARYHSLAGKIAA